MSAIPFEPASRSAILDASSLARGASAPSQGSGLFDQHLYGGNSQGGLSSASSLVPTSTPRSTESQDRRDSASQIKPAESSAALPRESENQRTTSSGDGATASVTSDSKESDSDDSPSSPVDASATEQSSPGAQSGDSRTVEGRDDDASNDDGEQNPDEEAAAQFAPGAALAPSATDEEAAETDAAGSAKSPPADVGPDSARQRNGAADRLQATQTSSGANGTQLSGEESTEAASGEANGDEPSGNVRTVTQEKKGGKSGDASKSSETADPQGAATSHQGARESQGSASTGAPSAAQVGQVQPSEQKNGSGNSDQRSRRRGTNSTVERIGKADAPNSPASQAGDAQKTLSDAARVALAVPSSPITESASHASQDTGTDRSAMVPGSTAASASDTRTSAHAGQRGAESPSSSPALSESDHARFMQRVVRAVHSAHQRNGEVRLRLSPPELGSLRIELRVEMGVMTARVEAETPETRSLLLDGLPQLRERLAEQGVRVERFDVDLLDRQGEQSPQGTTDNDSQEQQSPNRRAATEPSSQRASTSPSPTSSGRPNDDGKLNVLI